MEKILTEKSVLSENGQTFYWTSQANKEVTIVFLGTVGDDYEKRRLIEGTDWATGRIRRIKI